MKHSKEELEEKLKIAEAEIARLNQFVKWLLEIIREEV